MAFIIENVPEFQRIIKFDNGTILKILASHSDDVNIFFSEIIRLNNFLLSKGLK